MDFLKKLSQNLGFSDDDLENSLMAIEGFVLEHWEHLTSLQNKQDYEEVSDRFITRMSKITTTHKNRLLKEVQESQELMKLLAKAKSQELTAEEKKYMQEMLLTILKSIPTFVIISLPQRFLTLPMLMKILPNNFFAEVNKP
jgi:predicted NodU family carbamoyl transferase